MKELILKDETEKQITEYHKLKKTALEIRRYEDNTVLITDIKTEKDYTLDYIFGEHIDCLEIRHNEDYLCDIVSKSGILYRISPYNFEYTIKKIEFIEWKTINNTCTEFLKMRNLDEDKFIINAEEHYASYIKYEAFENKVINGRRDKELQSPYFIESLRIMLNEINNDENSDVSMRRQHEGLRPEEMFNKRI